MSATLVFGSVEANAILKSNREAKAKAAEDERLGGAIRRWRVTVEVTEDDYHYVKARTAEEAMAICRETCRGDPYDAELAKRQ